MFCFSSIFPHFLNSPTLSVLTAKPTIISGNWRTQANKKKEEIMPILPYKGIWPTIAEDVFIAPGAAVIGNVTIREGASIWYNAVLRGDSAPIVIGRRTNIQDNCTLHVDDDAS